MDATEKGNFVKLPPRDLTSEEILENCAGYVGAAVHRGESDPQKLYEDLGRLMNVIGGFRVDLARRLTAKGEKPDG